MLANLFTIEEVVVLKPDKKGFVRFQAGVVMGHKQSLLVPMQDAYAGHFIVRTEKGPPISYGERVWEIPMQEPWRVLIEVEVQLPLPRLSPIGPTRGIMFIDPRMAFEKYETTTFLLKDLRVLEQLNQLPAGTWTIVGIYKVPETDEEAEQQEKAWEDAQAFDPNPTNLPGKLSQFRMMVKAIADQLPQKLPKTEKSEEEFRKFKANLADLDKMQTNMNQMNFLSSVDGLVTQDLPAAQARLQDWIGRYPQEPLPIVLLGSVLAQLFSWDEAREAFSHASLLNPNDPNIILCRDLAQNALEEDKLRTHENTNIINFPSGNKDDPLPLKITGRLATQVGKALALFYYYEGNPAQGEVILSEIIRGGQEMGGDGGLYNSIAWIIYARRSDDVKLLHLGLKFAKEAFERSRTQSKELTVQALDVQGCLLCVLNEYEQARASFLAAIEANGTPNLGYAITWIEFKRTLKKMNDMETYQKFQEYF